MQDPNQTTPARKAWYQRAMEMALLCKTIASKPSEIPTTRNTTKIWKPADQISNNKHKVRKCSILSVTTSLTRVCLCVPISSYTYAPVLQADVLSSSTSTSRTSIYLRPKPPPPTPHQTLLLGATIALEGRRVFRGKSLRDDVLMRRFVIEEEAMWQVRRRNEMEVIRRRYGIRSRKQLGPSPLSKMVLAEPEPEPKHEPVSLRGWNVYSLT
ncbi:uncharacterized protein LOC116010990 [Ipomoea triloba]|uniref:uncharacterized protein LOC116010990 n=1 Tax=Ipomoea triloba TaxID=35885 RepID=UPI00125DD2FA|nr:uncharacterized protein LOC116010990 [Ipomoea triloba]